MNQTYFSVLTACYNTGEYVRACVESVLKQNYPRDHFELVCVDDGSTDDSIVILKSWTGQKGFVTQRTENRGLEAACNLAISLAKYDRVVRVDADDLLDTDFLRIMDEAIRRQPEADFYYCKNYVEYYNESEQYPKMLPDFDAEEIFSRGDFFATGTVYRKVDVLAVGGYPTSIKNCGLENYYLTLRLLSEGKRGCAVDGAMFCYRRHHNNMSTIKRDAIINFGKELLGTYGRVYKTNQYHPYGLQLSS